MSSLTFSGFFSKYFGNMAHNHETGNFSGVLLKIGKKWMTVILLFMPPFKEEGVYCFANVGQLVCRSVEWS